MPKYPQPRQFKPANISKYKGNPTQITYRSSWELKLMMKLDKHPDIIEWSSEGVVVSYISPIDRRPHRYFVDFYVKLKDKQGVIKTLLIEVKPYKQTIEPVKRKNMKQKTWINEVFTWGVNQAKWEAARALCAKKGWQFQVWTENELDIK